MLGVGELLIKPVIYLSEVEEVQYLKKFKEKASLKIGETYFGSRFMLNELQLKV